jgi:hypothetical protein
MGSLHWMFLDVDHGDGIKPNKTYDTPYFWEQPSRSMTPAPKNET